MLGKEVLDVFTMAVWLAFSVAICSECKVLAAMLPLEGCGDVEFWDDTSLVSAAVQSMA